MHRSFPVSSGGLAAAFAFIAQAESALGAPSAAVQRLSVIVDEVCANLLHHDQLPAEARFELDLQAVAGGVRMTIRDPGAPFDPLVLQPGRPMPGGHGLALVRGLALRVAYDRKDGLNCLVIEIDVEANP